MNTTLEIVLPKQHIELTQDEMMYLEGGVLPTVPALIKAIVFAAGAGYGGAYALGSRIGWMDSKENVMRTWNSVKWGVRAGVIASLGVFFGGAVIMNGFESGLYATLNSR